MDAVLDLLPHLLLVLISFACGYGLREWISWRRHAARKKFFQEDLDRALDSLGLLNPL